MYSSAKKMGVALSQPIVSRSRKFATHERGQEWRGMGTRARENGTGRLHALGGAGCDGHVLSIGVRDAEALAAARPDPALRRPEGDEETAVRALEALVPIGSPRAGLERLAAVGQST